MTYALTPYNGLQVVDPDPSGDGGKAINDNFKALATHLSATDDPPDTYDSALDFYTVGSRWINQATGVEWVCTDVGATTLEWTQILPTGTLNFTVVDYLRCDIPSNGDFLIFGVTAGLSVQTSASFTVISAGGYMLLGPEFTVNTSGAISLTNSVSFKATVSESNYLYLDPAEFSIETSGFIEVIAQSYHKITTPNTFFIMDNDIQAILMKNNYVGGEVKFEGVNGYASLGVRDSSDSTDNGRVTINPDGTIVLTSVFGMMLPKFTTTEKNAISSPPEGLMVYDTDLHQVSYFDGTSWVNI